MAVMLEKNVHTTQERSMEASRTSVMRGIKNLFYWSQRLQVQEALEVDFSSQCAVLSLLRFVALYDGCLATAGASRLKGKRGS